MATPVLDSKYDGLAAQLPESFTELWGARESERVPSRGQRPYVRDSRRPGNSGVRYSESGRAHFASGTRVAGGFRRDESPIAVGFRATPRLGLWVAGLGIALGALSGYVYVGSEQAIEYQSPTFVAEQTQ